MPTIIEIFQNVSNHHFDSTLSKDELKFLKDNLSEFVDYLSEEDFISRSETWYALENTLLNEKFGSGFQTVMADRLTNGTNQKFRALCAKLITHKNENNIQALTLASQDFSSDVRLSSVSSLFEMGIDLGYDLDDFYGYNQSSKTLKKLDRILNRNENIGYNLLLLNIKNKGIYQNDWYSSDEILFAKRSSIAFKKCLIKILENTTLFVEKLHTGKLNFSSSTFDKINGIIELCCAVFDDLDEMSNKAQELAVRILESKHPINLQGNGVNTPLIDENMRKLTKYYDERYANFRSSAYRLASWKITDSLKEQFDLDKSFYTYNSNLTKITRMKFGVKSRCQSCLKFLDNPRHTHCKKHYKLRNFENLEGQSLIDECVRRTNDKSGTVRRHAAMTLVNKIAIEELFSLLGHHHSDVLGIAVDGLMNIPGVDLSLVKDALAPDNSKNKRLAALRILLRSSEYDSMEIIKEIIEDSDLQNSVINQASAISRQSMAKPSESDFQRLYDIILVISNLKTANDRAMRVKQRFLDEWIYQEAKEYKIGNVSFKDEKISKLTRNILADEPPVWLDVYPRSLSKLWRKKGKFVN